MPIRNNHTRALNEVISIESWHSYDESSGLTALHIDISFREARLGEEKESKVRFQLGIKKAEISFIIPETEDIRVLQGSVVREPLSSGTSCSEISKISGAEFDASLAGAVSAAPTAEAKLKASTSLTKLSKNTTTLTREISDINWRQYKDGDGNYCWEVNATGSSHMIGKPWIASTEPRLQFKTDKNRSIPPVARISAQCKREDISIKAVELKNPSKAEMLTARFKNNKIAAAEAVLKHLLEQGSLEHSDLSERFSTVLLAETLVDVEIV